MDELRVAPDRKTSDGAVDPQATRRSRWKPIFWIGVIILLIAALAWWIHTRPTPRAPTGRFTANGPMPVVAATATKGDIAVTYDALGTVTPLATVTVVTQISGQLTQVAFTEGQEVKQGDFLAQIDPRPYQAALDQAQGQLARDQASLAMARIDLARYQKLAEQNAIARQQSEDQVYIVGQDEGTVKLDQAAVDNAKLNLAYCHIVAPVSGRIGLREVDQGNYIQVGASTTLAVITEVKPITVIFTLPEDQLPQVMARLQAGATLSVGIYDRANQKQLDQANLNAVDSTIDPTTGTVKLRAEAPNAKEQLFPNQFVNAELLIDTLKGTTIVPSSAIQRGQPGTFVYVIKSATSGGANDKSGTGEKPATTGKSDANSDETVSVVPVTTGPQQGEQIAITKGLNPGDKVVVDGADKLREGAKVVEREPSGEVATPAVTGGKRRQQGAGKTPTASSPPSPAEAPAAPPSTAPAPSGGQ